MKRRISPPPRPRKLIPSFVPPVLSGLKVDSPSIDFAVQNDMLSDQEINDCLLGLAVIDGSILRYGQANEHRLYQGRRLDKLADQILGLDES